MLLVTAALIYSSQFLTQCGPAVAPATTRAIIQVESGGNPLAIADNRLRKSFIPKNRDEAVALAAALIRQGHGVDLGLMQINSAHLVPMRLTLEQVFDPCSNVRAGTTILAGFYRRHRTEDPALSLFKALSAYNTGRAWRGPGYVNKVLAATGAPYRVSVRTNEERPVSIAVPKRQQEMSGPAASPLFFPGGAGALLFAPEEI